MDRKDLVTEISELSKNILELKKKVNGPKTKFEIFKEYAGVVSLVVGLLVGLVSLVTEVLINPKNVLEAQKKDLAETLKQIVTIETNYKLTSNKTLQGEYSSHQFIVLEHADDLCSENKHVATYRDHYLLGQAFEFAHDLQSALKHYKLALSIAMNDPEKAMAEANIAAIEYRHIDEVNIERARDKFKHALSLVEKSETYYDLWAIAYITGLQCSIECVSGDRRIYSDLKDKENDVFDKLQKNPRMTKFALDELKREYKMGVNPEPLGFKWVI